MIVTDNLFGDILTDLAAAVTGGIGLAASGNINPDRTTPCMFEPVHGSAPDIAGQQKSPTRPPRSCRSPCCSTTSVTPDAAAAVEGAVVADRADLAARVPAPRAPPRRSATRSPPGAG